MMHHRFEAYRPTRGRFERPHGVMVLLVPGWPVAFGLDNLQQRGTVLESPAMPSMKA